MTVNKQFLDQLINDFLAHGRLRSWKVPNIPLKTIESMIRICSMILLQESSLLELPTPCCVIGDIHGHLEDLIDIFRTVGSIVNHRFLFLGDYVDYGERGSLVLLFLIACKIRYPSNIYLLRGSHEQHNYNRICGFYMECRHLYPNLVYQLFQTFFKCLPFAAILSNTILFVIHPILLYYSCCHGGLSPHLSSLSTIQKIQRPCDIPSSGLLYDIVCSSPAPLPLKGWHELSNHHSLLYGEDIVDQFFKTTNIKMIIRSHQPVDGYRVDFDQKHITVYSTRHYSPNCNYGAGIVKIDNTCKCSFTILRYRRSSVI